MNLILLAIAKRTYTLIYKVLDLQGSRCVAHIDHHLRFSISVGTIGVERLFTLPLAKESFPTSFKKGPNSSEPPIWGRQKGTCSDLFRFPLPICSALRSLFPGIPRFVPICSDLLRFLPICSDLFSEQIRTDQLGKPLSADPFCKSRILCYSCWLVPLEFSRHNRGTCRHRSSLAAAVAAADANLAILPTASSDCEEDFDKEVATLKPLVACHALMPEPMTA